MIVDTDFDVFSDTPSGKDPDKYSPTLRKYHQYLWSKPLPDGTLFTLTDTKAGTYLYHLSAKGEFQLSSDAFSNTFQCVNRMIPITSLIHEDRMAEFFRLCSTIGAYILFPGNMIDKKRTINMARGCHPKIRDRIDLTLECIRRHYIRQESPLSEVLERYSDFFDLFHSFDGYVEFFLLSDLVDKGQVRFFLPSENFQRDGYPENVEEYRAVMHSTTDFVNRRNRRISELGTDG